MNIELFLILSAAYEYAREPMPEEDEDAIMRRRYITMGIESYLQRQGYTYNSSLKIWTEEAKKADIARRRTQGAKDGWEIRRGKQRGKQ
jgi:hypothetical protein